MATQPGTTDPNKGEYRQLIMQKPCPAPHSSIGALVFGDNLVYEADDPTYRFTPTIPYPLDSLDVFMGKMVNYARALSKSPLLQPAPRIEPGYKFSTATCLANGTCFYIGDGLIVTAGHCVFKDNDSILKPEIINMKVMFGLTAFDIGVPKIAAQRVSDIKIQDVPFTITKDRADWAILELVSRPNQQAILPPALAFAPLGPQQQVDNAWLAGHPWGIGLTNSIPTAEKPGFCKVAGTNIVSHNLLTAPASSGGPIFNPASQVIALVTSGGGATVESRGFVYMQGLSTYITPMPMSQDLTGTNTNIFSSLVQQNGTFFLACKLPDAPPPNPPTVPNTVTVKVLYGDTNDQANWQSFNLTVNQPAPINNIPQLAFQFGPLHTRPWHARALGFTYNFTEPQAAGHAAARRPVPRATEVIFGCFGQYGGNNPQHWTVLYKDNGPGLVPGESRVVKMPVFLGQDWKNVDGNAAMGLFDTRQCVHL